MSKNHKAHPSGTCSHFSHNEISRTARRPVRACIRKNADTVAANVIDPTSWGTDKPPAERAVDYWEILSATPNGNELSPILKALPNFSSSHDDFFFCSAFFRGGRQFVGLGQFDEVFDIVPVAQSHERIQAPSNRRWGESSRSRSTGAASFCLGRRPNE
jgi:hypothetical protein